MGDTKPQPKAAPRRMDDSAGAEDTSPEPYPSTYPSSRAGGYKPSLDEMEAVDPVKRGSPYWGPFNGGVMGNLCCSAWIEACFTMDIVHHVDFAAGLRWSVEKSN